MDGSGDNSLQEDAASSSAEGHISCQYWQLDEKVRNKTVLIGLETGR